MLNRLLSILLFSFSHAAFSSTDPYCKLINELTEVAPVEGALTLDPTFFDYPDDVALALFEAKPGLPPEALDVIEAEIREYYTYDILRNSRVRTAMCKAYKNHLTKKDVKRLIKFYKSSTGQKLGKALGPIEKDAAKYLKNREELLLQDFVRVIKPRLNERMAEHGW